MRIGGRERARIRGFGELPRRPAKLLAPTIRRGYPRPHTMTSPSRERRRAPRALADFSIQLNPKQGATPARVKDLSAIGLCCTTTARLNEMALVGIDLQLPGESKRHALQGAVVRCEPDESAKGSYELAVFFTQIDEAAKKALGAFVASGAPA